MINQLTVEQRRSGADHRRFAEQRIAPAAALVDAEQRMPREVIDDLAGAGLLAAPVPVDAGGHGMSAVCYGIATEHLGRACQSVRNLVAVQDMVASALYLWGDADQRRWIPEIAAGRALAAFALTEPGVGSDAASVATTATADGGGFRLTGRKRWISFAQIADVFLVLARLDDRPTAFLVGRDTPGLSVTPIRDLLGLRGSMLGEIELDGCHVPGGAMVGLPGGGLVFVASAALDLGRYSTACGAVGLAQACLDASAAYAGTRQQFGSPIREHQAVRRMIADMVADTSAGRLLCHHAGLARDQEDPDAVDHTLIAKYRTSTVASRSAADAVQIHGAAGIGGELPVQRHYRDAKVLEIIEGTTQLQQGLIGGLDRQPGERS